MSDLTVGKIIEIHDEIILKYDGAQGILSEAHFISWSFVQTGLRTLLPGQQSSLMPSVHNTRLWMETSGQRLSLLKMFSVSQVFLLQLMTI